MSDYRTLMTELFEAHQYFHQQWRIWKDGKLPKKERKNLKLQEPERVTLAHARMRAAFNNLFDTKINPLQTQVKLPDPGQAIDEIIEFLSIDIPAFRCGYVKEFFLDKLKNFQLSEDQIEKLKRIAIDQCETEIFRREFRRWCRLMIKLADQQFVGYLLNFANGSNRFAKIKSTWMLVMVLHHRKDLAKAILPEQQ